MASRPGPLADMAKATPGLPHAVLDDAGAAPRPSRHAAAQLTELARRNRIDVVHGYEWPSALEPFAGRGCGWACPGGAAR